MEKSLVNRVGTNVRARFRLNETMRNYGLERLHAASEVDATRSKHLSWYSQLGVRADADSFSSRLPAFFVALDGPLLARLGREDCQASGGRHCCRGVKTTARVAAYVSQDD